MEQQPNESFIGSQQPAYVPNSDEKTMGILAHILALVAPILAPLIIWLIKKDESAYVAAQAKESLNFQITYIIIVIGLIITIVGIFLIWLVVIANLVFVILATIKASESKIYRYPVSLRLIK